VDKELLVASRCHCQDTRTPPNEAIPIAAIKRTGFYLLFGIASKTKDKSRGSRLPLPLQKRARACAGERGG
jgi:hypothetical protein